MNEDDFLGRVAVHMQRGEATQAYDLIAPLESERAGDPAFDYLLGIASIDSGHLTRAIFALERVLAAQPGNTLARAEIARAYMMAGEVESARAQFTQVRSSEGQIPETARNMVEQFLNNLEHIQSERVSKIRAYVEAGLGYDSNVNSATGNRQVAIPAFSGAIFNLDPASRKRSDGKGIFGAGIDMRVPITTQLAFSGQANFSQTGHFDERHFNFGELDANATLAYTVDRHFFTAALQGSANWLAGDQYRHSLGLLGQWQFNIDSSSQTTAFAQLGKNAYPGQHVRDTLRKVLGAGYAKALGNRLPTVYGSAYFGNEDPRESGVPQIGFDFWGIRAGMQHGFRENLTGFVTGALEKRDYGGQEPFFNRGRDDFQTSIGTGLQYAIAKNWRLTPQLNYSKNNSNIAIYDFDRTSLSVMLRRQF